MRPQDGNIKAITSNPEHVLNVNQSEHPLCSIAPQTNDNNVINIQLSYNSNSPTKPDL